MSELSPCNIKPTCRGSLLKRPNAAMRLRIIKLRWHSQLLMATAVRAMSVKQSYIYKSTFFAKFRPQSVVNSFYLNVNKLHIQIKVSNSVRYIKPASNAVEVPLLMLFFFLLKSSTSPTWSVLILTGTVALHVTTNKEISSCSSCSTTSGCYKSRNAKSLKAMR